jgi:hypothetical protein
MYSLLPAPNKTESPSWRAIEVFEHFSSSSGSKDWGCPYKNQLNDYLVKKDKFKNSQIDRAYALYYLPFSRSALNALLMAGDSLYNISRKIEEEENTVLLYSKLFFDISVFPNKLIKMAFIRQMSASNKQEEFDKALMTSAIQLGPGYVYWKLGLSDSYDLAPDRVVVNMMADAYWKFNEMKIKNNFDITKESRSWIPAALSAAGMAAKNSKATTSESENVKIKLLSIAKTIPASEILNDLKG